jgi:hypothetical protein
MRWYARLIPRFRLRSTLIAIALITVLLRYVAVPAWDYYHLSPETRAVLEDLGRPMTAPPAAPATLSSFLKAIRMSSPRPLKPNGIPIYVDPEGLDKAAAALYAPLGATPGIVPIKIALERTLGPLGLGYYVRDGLLTVTSAADADRVLRENPKEARRP